ncbi:trans-alpha-bergamotene synthase [Phtheirospermum japonicum]|uniref:Trans-alpha-bergamotene synthase n=1 Tax=Phtheirospermum japonicum TaxID=374723 RepID=A0A830CCH5_9LAMI|nr:trans-alpha-bergamotene synthase [Phtheirospermum japonicum]
MEAARRSGNYESTIWDDNYVQSLTTPYTGQEYVEQAEKLKMEVKRIIDKTENELDQLELIDNLQRLCISNYFEDEVKKILETIYQTVKNQDKQMESKDLHFTALRFRLLRQHGYPVPQEAFSSFMDEDGNFKACLARDVKGILSLYEASFLSMEGENILDLAKQYSTHHLKETLEQITDPSLAELVKHALELPVHWRVHKLEAQWFINVYESKLGANLVVLQLAKLDYNMVQAKYQQELKQLSRWYKETGLSEKLGFARHRLAESFLWALGFTPEPQFGYSREISTKITILITIMDDIYDVYGTLDELDVFTDTVERWDINGLDRLPEYMRIYFLALFNFSNEMAYRILKEQGFNIISNLRQLWSELSRAYHLEARWFHSGYIPTTDEYLNGAWVSVSGPLALLHGYFSISKPINKKELRMLEPYPGIIRWPSMILRLADDLGTSSDEMKKGDVHKSIQCYMRETGCSAMNLGRISLCVYQFGDGFGTPHLETKENMVSLIIKPIPLP